jgi:hypothetical protein
MSSRPLMRLHAKQPSGNGQEILWIDDPHNSASQHSGLHLIDGHLYKKPETRQNAISVLLLAVSVSLGALKHESWSSKNV